MAEKSVNIGAIELNALCDFTSLLVSHGRDYAKDGQKDYARDIVRFVNNARILTILKKCPVGVLGNSFSRLEQELAWLSLECHPQDVPDYKPDLIAIRELLSQIHKNTDLLLRSDRADLVPSDNMSRSGTVGNTYGQAARSAACPLV